MLNCDLHRAELNDRLLTVRNLLDATHLAGNGFSQLDISRETRGLAIVLIYAAYENLLVSLSRSILEAAQKLGVGNRRLRPGLQLIAAHSKLQALSAASEANIWKSGLAILDVLGDSSTCTINPAVFPNNGSNFKRPQVTAFCDVFGLGDPGAVLREAWNRLDTIVSERNSIAHGSKTPAEVGRAYSEGDLRDLLQIWGDRWGDFITWVEACASSRDFFRTKR